MCGELLYIAPKSFPSGDVRAKPLIRQGRIISEGGIRKESDKLEAWRDVMIWGLWYRHTDVIVNVKLGYDDADNYRLEPMEDLLDRRDKKNNYKHGKHLHNQQRHFSLFVISIDGILGRETLVLLTNLIWLMAEKTDNPILHVCGCINGPIEISVERSYSRIIRGTRLPGPLRDREPDWGPTSGLGLAH